MSYKAKTVDFPWFFWGFGRGDSISIRQTTKESLPKESLPKESLPKESLPNNQQTTNNHQPTTVTIC
ncbi:hypothetical protein AM228_27460 [Planktothricoides sp. SR001]|nr:hypothetical protein AM228_27460 [Planktothricoides sp. SR001]MBD2586291.1 hypothetical protein [Planktothricoides raciborskii FACHB-1261]